jgi:hypothetical protein
LPQENPVTTDNLTAARRDTITGSYTAAAGVALLTSKGTFLRRDDFTTRFIEHDTSGGTPMAAIDWEAAITALNAGSDREVAAVGVAFFHDGGHGFRRDRAGAGGQDLVTGPTCLMEMAVSEASRTFVPAADDSPQPCSTRPSSIAVSSVVNQL